MNACMFISSHRILVGVIALIELLLLSKWYNLPSFVFFFVCVFVLCASLAHAYFKTKYSPWAVELIGKWIKNECILLLFLLLLLLLNEGLN
jgi:hypothetical protein